MTDTPVTVLSGYLGAGKTTLLNGLLATADGRRIGVVVNDFGAVNVDASLVRSRTSDTIELTDGCICCSLRGEVGEVMRRLAARTDLDDIVVEASGVADPAGLAAWGSFPGLAAGGTVVCVDSTTIGRLLRDAYVGDVVHAQVRRADTLVLTRCDLLTADAADHTAAGLATLAPDARTLRSAAGSVTADELLTQTATTANRAESVWAGTETIHLSREVALPGPVDVRALEQALLGWPDTLVRAKGIVQDSTRPGSRVAVQLAGGRTDSHDCVDEPSWLGLVLIVAGPQAEQVAGEVEAALRHACS